MAWETVEVFITLDATEAPVPGALVRFFDSTGVTIYTEATSDADGKVSVLLPVGLFTARFYKFAHTFPQPQALQVAESVLNSFDVVATAITPPLASDPRLCRCSGYFRDLTGAPKAWLDMHFRAEFSAMVLAGSAVITDTVLARTDSKGWAQIDLIRGGKYQVVIEALNCERYIMVPDASSANLPDVLLAVVDRVTFDIDPVEVAVGDEVDVTPTVRASSGVPLVGTANSDVDWSVEDDSIATIQVKEFVITVTGRAAGTTTIRAVRKDLSIVRIPNTAIVGQPLQVTVA
jgi:uncharacterized protein YjdB